MTRLLGFWLGLLCCFGPPGLALAQDDSDDTPDVSNSSGGLLVQLLLIGEESYNAMQNVPLGKRACDDNVVLKFRISNLATGPSSARYLEIWKGTACNTSDAKDAVGDDDCVRIKYEDRIQSMAVQEPEVEMKDLCDEDGDTTLYFLPVDALDTNENLTVYGQWRVSLDIAPPEAPGNVRGGAGETEIPIEWTPGGANISYNYLLWDSKPFAADADGGTDGGAAGCASTVLIPGEAIELGNLPAGVRSKKITGDVDIGYVSGDELGAARVAMAVVAEDLAGNISLLSNIACVQVVRTDGFWDAYRSAGGDAETGCACSLPGARTSPLAILPVALALLVLRIRRKSRS